MNNLTYYFNRFATFYRFLIQGIEETLLGKFYSCVPMFNATHLHIKLAGERVCQSGKRTNMRPTELDTHCVPNLLFRKNI